MIPALLGPPGAELRPGAGTAGVHEELRQALGAASAPSLFQISPV